MTPVIDDPVTAGLLSSALDLLAEEGRQDFSLRRVADAAGVFPSVASRRFGNKAGLLAALADLLLAREAQALSDFAANLGAPCAPDDLGAVLAAWFGWRTRWVPRQARALAELQGLEAVGGGLSARTARTYVQAFNRLAPELAPEHGLRLASVAVVEGLWWLALGDEVWFQLLSAETLAQAAGTAGETVWAARFAVLREDLAPRSGPAGRVAEAAANVIETQGAAAVTHRSVASQAGVTFSSVAYHYGVPGDLLDAGLLVAADRYVQALGGDAPIQGRPRALTPFDVALRSLASPLLRPAAARVRKAMSCALGGAEPHHDPVAALSQTATAITQLRIG